MQTDEELAAALINARHLPHGLSQVIALSKQARAYQAMNPYPRFHFQQWMSEDRGPLPRCLPTAKSIVQRGAKWLFGKPVQISAPKSETLEARLRDAWLDNRMDSRLVAIARDGALDGGVALKFSYQEGAKPEIAIQSLSIVDECRLFFHPHDCDKLLMARVQYPYFDAASGETFWYREEWTAAEEIHYLRLAATTLGNSDPDKYDGWVIDNEASQPNPFGVIPLMLIKNIETDDQWGAADLWHPAEGDGLYRIVDRINLTFHLMDKSNQFDAETNPIYIDLDVDDQDIDKPLQPGQALELHSSNEEKQGKVEFPRGGNALRPAMMEYAKELRKQVLEAASSVSVDQAEFTNKGNLTSAVLEQLYQPQIEITNEKRKSYGQDGLAKFLSLITQGLENAGVDLGAGADAASAEVLIKFSPYFDLSEDEKAAKVARLQEEDIGGYLPHKRAIEEISQMEGRDDIEAIKAELTAQPAPSATENDPAIQTAQDAIRGLQREGGPAAA